MLSDTLIVARKELVDHLRDRRTISATGLYTLMGPLVVVLVTFIHTKPRGASDGAMMAVVPILASVFAVVCAFTGGMSVAVDSIAGERERESLSPLFSNTVEPYGVVLGKWLAVSVLSMLFLLLNLLAFALLLRFLSGSLSLAVPLSAALPALLALVVLSSALQILISARSRNVKEANTYVSMAMFGVMAFAMCLAFRPRLAASWWFVLPVAGHQRLLQLALSGHTFTLQQAVALALATGVATALVLLRAVALFSREEVLYGN